MLTFASSELLSTRVVVVDLALAMLSFSDRKIEADSLRSGWAER